LGVKMEKNPLRQPRKKEIHCYDGKTVKSITWQESNWQNSDDEEIVIEFTDGTKMVIRSYDAEYYASGLNVDGEELIED